MSEVDITYQMSEIFNRTWDLQQWWASVSFGVLVVAYLVGKQLNAFLLFTLLLLYSVYSIYMWDLLSVNFRTYAAYAEDLRKLSDSGVVLSSGAQAYIVQPKLGQYLAPVALVGTYVSVLFYTLYVYIRRKVREDT